MTIEAYLDPEENETVAELKELSPEAYKGIADGLSINNAEQAIIDEISGVDGDEDDSEAEELETERETKTLFESLYEIDPDTKEVFVKGSAYDLKKWEDDMVCFVFGDPERVVALEDSISPAEHRLTQAWDRLEHKRTALSQIVKKHANILRAQTISKAFAVDYQAVMGHPIPNIRMESFTTEPSTTNYTLAMEEMNAVQMAIAGGAALAGVGIVYKMIQWFSKTLNKNGEATNAIGQNFTNYKERKNKIETAKDDAELDKETIDSAIKQIDEELGKGLAANSETAVAELKTKLMKDISAAMKGGKTNDIFKKLDNGYLKTKMSKTFTPFHLALFTGKINTAWWGDMKVLVDRGLEAMDALTSALDKVSTATELDDGKPEPIQFAFLEQMNALKIQSIMSAPSGNFKTWDKGTNNWEEAINSFMAAAGSLTTPYANLANIDFTTFNFDGIENMDLGVFQSFSSEKIDKLVENANKLHTESQKAYTAMAGSDTAKDGRIEKRRDRLNLLAKEFKAVANVVRFVIQIRNQLGNLSVAMNYSSERSVKIMEGLGILVGSGLNTVSSVGKQLTSGIKQGKAAVIK